MNDLAHHFELPIEDPVLVFALVMVLLLIAPLLAKRVKLPSIVGLLIAGAAVGPHGFDLLERGEVFELLGTVGLLYIMFVAGLEIDLNRFKRYARDASVFGAATFLIPQALGTAAGFYFLGGWLGLDMGLAESALLASMFASHTLIAYPLISDLDLSENGAVTASVASTIITDLAALLVLAVVMGSHRGELGAAFWIGLVGGLAVFVALLFWGVPKLGNWFFRNVSSKGVEEYVFVLAVVFVAAFLSEVAGVEAIIGAFLAGLVLNRLVPESSTLMNRIEFVGNALFIPFFLVSVGMLVDVSVLFSGVEALIVAATMIVLAVLGKFITVQLMRKVLGYGPEEAMVAFGLTVAQAAATLAVVLVAYDAGIFGKEIMNGTILMIAVTCFVAPMVTEKYGRRLAKKEAEEKAAEAPDQRIMIAVQDEESLSNLLGVSFLIRASDSEEPLFPLTVVHEDEEVPERLADAEKLLETFVEEGAGAEIPVQPITRMSEDRADEISRAVIERRVTHVVIGLPRNPSERDGVGPVAERILEKTNAQVLVCRLTVPINTVERAVVAFGPGIADHEGFLESLETLTKLCKQVGANITGLCRDNDRDKLEERYGELGSELSAEFEGFAGDESLWEALVDGLKKTDMVVVLGDRPDTDGWAPLADRLLDEIDELPSEDILFFFPPRPDQAPPELVELPTELSTPQWPSRGLRSRGRQTDGVTS